MRTICLLQVVVLILGSLTAVRTEDSIIVIRADKPAGRVVRDLLGTEIKCHSGGQGLMTGLRGAKNEFRPVLMEWIEKLQPGFMRYKFMRGQWNWEDGIGPMAARKNDGARQKVMGVDELMAFQMRIVKDASKCHLVVNPRNPEQSAALVAYLNTPADNPATRDPVIGVSQENGRDYKTAGYWAKLRAENGHPEPFGVKWFELGNENYAKDAGFNGDPHAYCEKAKEVVKAMKAIDRSIRCGLNMEAYPIENPAWRNRVIEEGGAFADFFVCHAYYPMSYPRNSEYVKRITNMDKRSVEELYYKMVMAGAHQGWSDWRWFRGQMNALTPRAKEISLCLTENGFQLEVEDPKAQNTVLVGVYDVDLIGMMLEHARELKLENANLFYLEGDDPFCFLQHTYERSDTSGITVRPAFYALSMWTHYFGDTLLATDVTCGAFSIPLPKGDDWPKDGILWSRIAAQESVPLLAAHASLAADGKTLYLIVVNRDLYDDIESEIQITGFTPQPRAEIHTLNTSVVAASKKLEDMFAVWDSSNEETPDTVKIRDANITDAKPTFRHRFPAHSATALVLRAAEHP